MNSRSHIKLVRQSGGAGVVLESRAGSYFQLNAIAAEILSQKLEGATRASVVANLASKFPQTDSAVIESDVDRTLDVFRSRGWVE